MRPAAVTALWVTGGNRDEAMPGWCRRTMARRHRRRCTEIVRLATL